MSLADFEWYSVLRGFETFLLQPLFCFKMLKL